MTITQNPNPADELTATYLWSKNLVNFWKNGELDDSGISVDFGVLLDTPALRMTTVTATVTGTPVERLFVVVKVSSENPL